MNKVLKIISALLLALIAAVLHQSATAVRNTADELDKSASQFEQSAQDLAGVEISKEIFTVKRVVDGDTIELSNGQKVRYIGIDTPEMNYTNNKEPECFAKEATKKNQELVQNKKLILVRDVNNTDKYGRLLRYVYIKSADNTEPLFINEELVRSGFAHARSYKPDIAKQNILRDAERYARENNLGLWNKNTCK